VGFVVEKFAVEGVSLRALRTSPANKIATLFHVYSFIYH
jgi:hypothetical protein